MKTTFRFSRTFADANIRTLFLGKTWMALMLSGVLLSPSVSLAAAGHTCSKETCSAQDRSLDDSFGFVPQSPDFSEKNPRGKAKAAVRGKREPAVSTELSRAVAPAGGQPAGALTDRVVFTSAGHGWTYGNGSGGSGKWFTQRGVTQEMNEDYGNLDQMNMFAYYAFNAGATVVAMRPIGNQTNEVVLDNVNAAVTWSGTWSDSSSTIFYGSAGQTPYRFASVASTETATATYTPNIPKAGYYPVYTWARHGSDRTKQLYRINHTGGQSQVRIPHYMVGNGWVYLGTYYFNAGSSSANGSVVISNLEPSPTVGSVIIADAIRFGNGMGNVVPTAAGSETPTISKYPREEECSRYWIQRAVGQGMSSSIYNGSSDDQDDNVGAPARMAREMNREASGNIYKRIYLGFHSNAGGGSARGTLGLYNNTSLFPGTATPNQFRWAQITGKEVNDDMVGIGAPPMELAWHNRGTSITYARTDFAFGEINNNSISSEFDATIIEVAYHDNASDAKLMRDPRARDWTARACLHAVVKYMNEFDSLPLNFLPEPPTNLRAVANTSGGIVLSWNVPTAAAGSGAATSYIVYRSTDGYGFGNPVNVSGGSTTTTTITGLSADVDYYFRIAAVNAGGESMPSDTVGCRRSSIATARKALFVSGYDRFGRFANLRQSLTVTNYVAPGKTGTFDRVLTRTANTFDYVVQHGKAISAYGMPFDTCANDAVIGGQIKLTNYAAVIWACGNESTGDETFSSAEQTLVIAYLNANGNLFVSGSEIGWDLDRASGPTTADRAFMNNNLRAKLNGDANDDSGSYTFSASGSSIFAGNANGAFDDGNQGIYRVDFPDVLTPTNGSIAAMNYVGGIGGAAAIQYNGTVSGGKVIFFGFPFETITSATVRNAYMADILKFFSNTAPVLAAIGNKTGNELSAITFTASATDTDIPTQTLTYTLDAGAPSGASINSSSGAFSWTPTEAQGPGVYNITVRVTDNGSPALNDFETISVTVNEVNAAPVLAVIGNKTVNELSALTFTASATDSDNPANTLTYTLDAGAPSGASINSSSGAFSWTPTEAQGPGVYNIITVRVTDNGSPALNDFETISVTVNEANVAPVLSLGSARVTETFAHFETFADGFGNDLVMFRKPSNSGTTSGFLDATPNTTLVTATFPSGHSSARVLKSSFSFKTGTTNPWLRLTSFNSANLPNPTIDFGQTLRFDIYTDKTLKVGLGLRETGTSAAIGANGGTTGAIEFVGVPTKTGSMPNPSRTVTAGSWVTLEFTLPTEPAISFSSGNGVLAAGKGVLEHLALVPAGGLGAYNVYLDNFQVIYTQSMPSTINMNTDSVLSFTASATDSDLPAQTLSFSLDAGAPAGASINSGSGAFTWTPTSGQAATHNLTVRATDNGPGNLSDAEPFTVIVTADPMAPQSGANEGVVASGETVSLSWNAVPGRKYLVQYKDSLSASDWTTLQEITASSESESVTVENGDGERFYRIVLADDSAAASD